MLNFWSRHGVEGVRRKARKGAATVGKREFSSITRLG